MINRGLILSILLCSLGQASLRLHGGWLDPRFDLAGANGNIYSLVEYRGALYAIGDFTRIAGINAPGLAHWNGVKWEAIQPELNASVFAAVATVVVALPPAPPQRFYRLRWQ